MCLGVLASGCHQAVGVDDTGGRPLSPGTASPFDGAPDDAYRSPRRPFDASNLDAGTFDAPPMTAADAAGPVVNDMTCNACELASCRNVDDNDFYGDCFLAMGNATAGPAAGMPKAALCQAVLHCARVTGCALSDPQPCYCGAGVTDLQCLAGNAVGPCKAEVEAAAESAVAGDVANRLADPAYAAGAAFNLLRYCEAPICHASCVGVVGGLPDGGMIVHPDAGTIVTPDAHPIVHPDAHPMVPDAGGITTTLVANGRFDHDSTAWTPEFNAAAGWDGAHDALGGTTSGSITVTDTTVAAVSGSTMAGAWQCVPALPATAYMVSAQAFLSPGQGDGSAGLNLQFFASNDCSGLLGGAFSTDFTSVLATWSSLSGKATALADTHSIRVRVVVVKPFSAPAFQAHFDNVLLEKP